MKRGDEKNEEWRITKKLGSLMGDQEDILRRKQLSTTTPSQNSSFRGRKPITLPITLNKDLA